MFHQNTFHNELIALRAQGEVRLSEASSRLRLQIDSHRALTNVIANDTRIVQAIAEQRYAEAKSALEEFEATYGAWRIDLSAPDGTILFSSSNASPDVRHSDAFLQAALNNRLGFAQALENGERIIKLSRSVLIDHSRPAGVVVLSVSLAALEFEWPVAPEPIVFFDVEQLAFSSNRPNLLLLSRGQDPEIAAFNLTKSTRNRGLQLWQFRPPNGDFLEVIKAEQFVPHLDLTGVIFLDTSEPRATARLRSILVLAGAAVLGLIGTVALQQRRGRVFEQQYSSQLEARVEARTHELRGAQDALVEASKLAALGRLSAGVSHELNQPLAAILNFAENGQQFLARGRSGPAAQNLTLISDQVRRMARIIGNLRAFARQEVAPTEQINFGNVVASALELSREDIAEAGVTLDCHLPEEALFVLAGQVRLEQVVLNLISNALDAMAQSKRKDLSLALRCAGDTAVLTLSDTGHGIADVSAVFEPFYTTKDLGASKGLGMGLALAHGIIARFGGTLSCNNLDVGAEFRIVLPIVEGSNA
ncbi:MAG: ATP-binding protein [Tateyamaria sp.]|uniref:sensor histidine kinase n=1 Tax=Tateyamaria sp. TaxID=1929288 RepID=UPI003295E5FF